MPVLLNSNVPPIIYFIYFHLCEMRPGAWYLLLLIHANCLSILRLSQNRGMKSPPPPPFPPAISSNGPLQLYSLNKHVYFYADEMIYPGGASSHLEDGEKFCSRDGGNFT